MKKLFIHIVAVLAFSGIVASSQQQAGEEGQTGDLQKEVQNPVASLISVPLQNNMNFGIGPLDRTQNVLKSSR